LDERRTQASAVPRSHWPPGPGDMAPLIRARDWTTTPLGPLESWPQSLKTAVDLVLASPMAMIVLWGPELVQIYNDGYRIVMGGKHPSGLGQPTRECWPELWDFHASIYDAVFRGEARSFKDQKLTLERHGHPEEAWFDLTFSPLRDEASRVAGVLVTVVETTTKVVAERQLANETERLRDLFHQAPGFMAVVRGPEHRFEIVNASYYQLVGHREIVGKPLLEALPEIEGQVFAQLLDNVYRTGEPYVGYGLSIMLQREPGASPEQRFINFVYQPIRDADGTVTGIFAEGSDVTEAKRSEIALRESEQRLRLALDAGRMAVWETDSAKNTIKGSPELNRLFGFPPDAYPTLEEIQARYAPGERERIKAVVAAATARGERFAEVELEVIWPNGSHRWVLLRAEMEISGPGQVKNIGVAMDITDRKRAEQHQQLLINELNHRVKNTLATVQSITSQSLRGASSPEDARAAIESRLLALSRAHDVLTRENWEGASLRQVVEQATAPFSSAQASRFQVSGPYVRLPPRMALALSMAFQELATNAAKYGSLSTEAGEVVIRWAYQDQGAQRLHLVWQEIGGPPVTPPTRRGFGTRLIERSLAQDLNGDVTIEFAPDGVICTVDAPLPFEDYPFAQARFGSGSTVVYG